MNEELPTIQAKQVFGAFSFNRSLLVWYSYETHMTDSVRKDLKEKNVDSVIIPGRCTKYIEATDMWWNKSFKACS